MGLLILILVGALLGWVGSIVFQRELRSAIFILVFAGMAGAVLGGLLMGSVPLLAGLGPMQLLWALIGAAAAIVVVHIIASNVGDGAYH